MGYAGLHDAGETAPLLLHWRPHLQRNQRGTSMNQRGTGAVALTSVIIAQDKPPSLHSRASMGKQVHTFTLALHAFALHLLQQGRVLPKVVLHGRLAVPWATCRDGGGPVPLLGLVIPLCHRNGRGD